jgi:hypothetical protein
MLCLCGIDLPTLRRNVIASISYRSGQKIPLSLHTFIALHLKINVIASNSFRFSLIMCLLFNLPNSFVCHTETRRHKFSLRSRLNSYRQLQSKPFSLRHTLSHMYPDWYRYSGTEYVDRWRWLSDLIATGMKRALLYQSSTS